jgi:hypothetical protein
MCEQLGNQEALLVLIAPTVLSQLGGDKDGLMKKFSKWHWLG